MSQRSNGGISEKIFMNRREIKFRVWDLQLKKFVPFNSYWCNFNSPSHIFQQYTGLKDRDGKEIFDGDILTNTLSSDRELTGEVIYESSAGGYVIKWFKGPSHFFLGLNNINAALSVVIGNSLEEEMLDNSWDIGIMS